MFAGSFSTYPLTFTFTGQAEAPQGKADVLAVKGPGGFALRLLVDDQTHLPIMVSWTVPATNVVMTVPGQPAPEQMPPGSVVVQAPPAPGAGATNQERQEYAAAVQDLRKRALAGAKPVEYRIYYADYRDCGNGVRFPFRLRRAIAGETVEETNFDSFRINARIDARKFETLK
jgi:phytoene dehydrogenase-like protein